MSGREQVLLDRLDSHRTQLGGHALGTPVLDFAFACEFITLTFGLAIFSDESVVFLGNFLISQEWTSVRPEQFELRA